MVMRERSNARRDEGPKGLCGLAPPTNASLRMSVEVCGIKAQKKLYGFKPNFKFGKFANIAQKIIEFADIARLFLKLQFIAQKLLSSQCNYLNKENNNHKIL